METVAKQPIIDADTHWSEPHDLWTSLAPAKYRDLVPQIKEHRGKPMWVVNGDIPLAGDSAGGGLVFGMLLRMQDEDLAPNVRAALAKA